MKPLRVLLTIGGLVWAGFSVQAQIRWWGIYDFRLEKGGEDSNPWQNHLPNEHLQLSAHQFHLFADADLSDGVGVHAMVANNPARSFDLKQIEIQLAYVSFDNLIGNALSVSVGKILTPFGAFPKRQLAPDNPLIGRPLFFDYALKISPVTGYLDSTGVANAAGQYGGRLTSIYPGAYYVGVEAAGSFFDDVLSYDVALMNAPLSAVNADYNMQEDVSFHGRLGLRPGIWGSIGVSYASGPFMQSSWYNQSFARQYGPLTKFKQSSYGVDVLVSYLFYELNAEYILNRFDSPYITLLGGGAYGNWWANRTSGGFESDEFLVDLKVEAPFYPGLFLAARFDKMSFAAAESLKNQPSLYSSGTPWDHDVTRYAVSLGYTPVHGVLIKLGYESTSVDVHPKPNLDVMACNLVVTF